MMEALIRGFVLEDWVNDLDFSTLTRKETEHISDKLDRRHNDVIWRINYKNMPVYLVFLLEFQTRSDYFMAARLLAYAGLVYQSLIKEKEPIIQATHRLPPIFSIVFYTGHGTWKGAHSLRECLMDNIGLDLGKYQPNIRYYLLDITRLMLEDYGVETDNLVLPVVELAKAKDYAEAVAIVDKMVKIFASETFDNLRRDIVTYLAETLSLAEKCPGVTFSELQEVGSMLAENLKQWENKIRRQEREEGKLEGKLEGKRDSFFQVIQQILAARKQALSQEMRVYLSMLPINEIEDLMTEMIQDELTSDTSLAILRKKSECL